MMRCTTAVAVALLVAFIAASPTAGNAAATPADYTSWTSMSSTNLFNGDATFYGQQGGRDNAGSCSLGADFSNTLGLPWTKGIENTVAINDAQYAGGLACGMCIMYRGVGGGIGNTPVPEQWKKAFVSNRCPECAFGSIDMNKNGDGRWKAEWYPVACDTGDSKFQYDMGGKPSAYWFMFTISNTRVPVKSVEYMSNGNWQALRRSMPDNHWAANGGPFTFPIKLRLTSVLGDIVEDTLPSLEGGKGTAQFPDHAAGGAAPAAPAAAAASSAAPSAAPAAQAATPQPASDTVTAFSGSQPTQGRKLLRL